MISENVIRTLYFDCLKILNVQIIDLSLFVVSGWTRMSWEKWRTWSPRAYRTERYWSPWISSFTPFIHEIKEIEDFTPAASCIKSVFVFQVIKETLLVILVQLETGELLETLDPQVISYNSGQHILYKIMTWKQCFNYQGMFISFRSTWTSRRCWRTWFPWGSRTERMQRR